MPSFLHKGVCKAPNPNELSSSYPYQDRLIRLWPLCVTMPYRRVALYYKPSAGYSSPSFSLSLSKLNAIFNGTVKWVVVAISLTGRLHPRWSSRWRGGIGSCAPPRPKFCIRGGRCGVNLSILGMHFVLQRKRVCAARMQLKCRCYYRRRSRLHQSHPREPNVAAL